MRKEKEEHEAEAVVGSRKSYYLGYIRMGVVRTC